MKRMTLALLLGLLGSPTVQAMTWQELQTEISAVESGAAGNREIILRFSEMVQMMVVYTTAIQEVNPAAHLFCPPQGTPMNIDEIVSLVRAEARNSQATDSTSVQSLMLSGFRERFPCVK